MLNLCAKVLYFWMGAVAPGVLMATSSRSQFSLRVTKDGIGAFPEFLFMFN